jgi:hypothetical protein
LVTDSAAPIEESAKIWIKLICGVLVEGRAGAAWDSLKCGEDNGGLGGGVQGMADFGLDAIAWTLVESGKWEGKGR